MPIFLSFFPYVSFCCCSVANSVAHSFTAPWTAAHQAPLFMGLPRQEYWSGLPFCSPEDLSDAGIKPACPLLVGGFFTTEPQGKPHICKYFTYNS